MEICSISLSQALGIWSELWQAYYGKNGFGSDTAEIYAYRLFGHNPILFHTPNPEGPGQADTMQRYAWEQYQQAGRNLQTLLMAFEKQANCTIEVDGKSLREWSQGLAFRPLMHRSHVKVIPKEQR